MFELDWANRRSWGSEPPLTSRPSAVDLDKIQAVSLLHWQEHCSECAPPQCYRSCRLFVKRADKKCARFNYGIYPNPRFFGVLPYGADVRFRRWGKLETHWYTRQLSLSAYRRVAFIDRAVTTVVNSISGALAFASPRRRLNGAWHLLRGVLLSASASALEYDEFVLECFSAEPQVFRLILEHRSPATIFRHAFDISPGHNLHTLPAGALQPPTARSSLVVYPQNDAEVRLVILWMDLVKHVDSVRNETPSKVKCVAWDLDGVLWEGVLVEQPADALVLNPEAKRAIIELDRRGILNTIVSKNDFDQAWPVIEKMGLGEYFVYPAINWGQKSENLKSIAKRLNLSVDSFAVVDDSSFERAEIRNALPKVRVYGESERARLLDYEEFNVPVTETARSRRALYRIEMQRESARTSFSGSYEAFLVDCRIEMVLFRPNAPAAIERCLELIQRTNQLNISGIRYSEEQLVRLLRDPTNLCVGMECADRFGQYGIVGFARVSERKAGPELEDFVISCRVAQKHMEQTFVQWLAVRYYQEKKPSLRIRFLHSSRNGPLYQAFSKLSLQEERVGDVSWLSWDLRTAPRMDTIITVRDKLDARFQ